MKVTCPNCSFTGNINDKLVPDEGRNISCPKCNNRFFIHKPSLTPPTVIIEPKHELEDSQSFQGKKCPNPLCQYPDNRPNANFCEKCGTKLIDDEFPAKESQIDYSLPKMDRMVTPAKTVKNEANNRKYIIPIIIVIVLCMIGLIGLLIKSNRKELHIPPNLSQNNQPSIPTKSQDSAKTLLDEGKKYFNKGNYPQAIECINRLIVIEPTNVEAYVLMGRACFSSGNSSMAIDNLTKAIELSPNYNAEAYFFRAQAYFLAGKDIMAIDDLNTVITLQPNNGEAYCFRGTCYGMLGKTIPAAKDYRTACNLGYKDGCDNEKLKFVMKDLEGFIDTAKRNCNSGDDFWCRELNDIKKYFPELVN